MQTGFVLIEVAPLRESEVFNQVSAKPGIIEVHSLFSEWSLIAKIQAEDQQSIGEIVTTMIRRIDGVVKTKTLAGTK